MTTLDKLIIEVAQSELAQSGLLAAQKLTGDIAIFSDPNLELTRYALQLLQQNPQIRLYVGARDVLQAFTTLDVADEAGVADRVFISGYQHEIQLDIFFADARTGFGGAFVPANITLALSHLPKSLAELAYYAQSLAYEFNVTNMQENADSLHPNLIFICGGNNKYMSRSQNEVLAESFMHVQASRGRGKFRCLIANKPKMDCAPYAARSSKLDISNTPTLFGVGGVFSGAKADAGGYLLGETAIADMQTKVQLTANKFHVLDLGCGNALLSRMVFDAFPDVQVTATDISADAVCSAHLTLLTEILDKRAKIKWDDSARSLAADCADIVLLNPPFHSGNKIDATIVQPLLEGALRTLKPGGKIYMVHNSYLRYRPELEKRFTNVKELQRNAKFTVLSAEK